MKGLHKKIGVGVLVSGLLIGGVSFPSGSVVHANSKSNKSSVFVEIKDVLSGFNLEIPDILEKFLKHGFRGILEDDYNRSELPSVLSKLNNSDKKDVYQSISRLGESGGYAVIGFKLDGKKYFINSDYAKYWNSSNLVRINYNKFVGSARKRFESGGDKFKGLRLESGYIYKIKIEGEGKGEREFLISIFDKYGM